MQTPDRRRRFDASLLAYVLCLAIVAWRSQPPQPVADGSGDRFSAVAAAEILESIYTDRVTHPIGTASNRLYKQRILDRLESFGYEPEVQRAFVCRESSRCGHVENVLARLEGSGPGDKAVLLAVHYDSVGAGPSVSDDGVAVAATLEIARLLRQAPPPPNDVIFLIDDGEEFGLLGAIAFSTRHRWARDVGAVVNLEARGTGGKSYMFETGADNAWLIDLMDRHVPRPASTSFFYSIYQKIPNDTDFTVFKKHGMNGVNFAFLEKVVHYHTPLDNLDHYSRSSLQHQGENALAMVRAFAGADLGTPPAGTASWFDIFGFDIVSWPQSWNLPLAILSLLLTTLATGLHLAKGRLAVASLAWGQLLFPAALLASTLAAAALAWLLTSPGNLPSWPALSWAPRAAFWLVGISIPALVVSGLARRTDARAAWLAALEWLGLLALLCSLLLPGASYLFLAPALAGGLMAVAEALISASWLGAAATFVTVLAAGTVQLPLAWDLWEAMGIGVMPAVAFLVSTGFLLALIPGVQWARPNAIRAAALGALGLALFLGVVTVLSPPYSAESPRTMNLYFVQDADSGAARLAAREGRRPMPDSMRAVVEWQDGLQALYPWSRVEAGFRIADVAPLPVGSPRLEIEASETTPNGRRILARLTSPRGADSVAMVFPEPGRIASLELDDWQLDLGDDGLARGQDDATRTVYSATMPTEGISVRMEVSGSEPLGLHLVDYTYGLPEAADRLLESRPPEVVPINRGDLTIVFSAASL